MSPPELKLDPSPYKTASLKSCCLGALLGSPQPIRSFQNNIFQQTQDQI